MNKLNIYKDPRYIHLNEDLDEDFTLGDFYEENGIPTMETQGSPVKL